MEHFIWNIDPTILHLGPLQLRWYGILFVGSFFLGAMILSWIYKREGKDPIVLESLFIYLMVGTIAGARLVHCLFYEPAFYLSHPLEILFVWKGGLASHGGLLGVLIAMYIFAKKYKESYMWISSRVAIPGALTAAFIRLGNFLNSEILGLPSDVSWAIIFERVDMLPRHPVQLYEAFAYLLIFVLLLTLYRKITNNFSTKLLSGVFLTLIFTVRFALEYFKTQQTAYATNTAFSTGQILSVPFILVGLLWMLWAFKNRSKV